MSALMFFGPYILAVALAVGAMIVRNRDLGSAAMFRGMMGAAALLAFAWTGLLVALSRSDL
jgi:hypothetical protein